MNDSLFILLQKILPQHLLSRAVGKLAECRIPWVKNLFINWFRKRYQVDMSQALQPDPEAYEHFNAFFTRALTAEARPLDNTAGAILSPADGAISQLGAIDHGRIFQAKGHSYALSTLLGGDLERAKPFINGRFATVYLSPRDYHRVHMPISGTLRESVYIPGDLYSVNQVTAAGVDNLFARNERLVAIFDTELGPMAMVLVGAMIVAGIETVWNGQVAPLPRQPLTLTPPPGQAPIELAAGEEMGRFKLGSTVILLFGPDVMDWTEQLSAGDSVTMGRAIGQRHTAQ
ncbi:MAG: phosphatidylserine decarboxylase [Oceanospirillales bacterium]|uniref:Phosphatidylserine decarboxylase proenzyme n=1 Tax=Marinobacterium halophilum TaxID=267374 RepID=A0A2P8F3M8_9GAMM|nr:archaetidylserine decarboxylase [Marinobacterium halophilum]MBR9830040.1 phosphatidylserine decarboxylase [Oceanospirillales bacterium]PSL16327.1 phosphatidylserine decarboxylase [Marinobacterium halophilum]